MPANTPRSPSSFGASAAQLTRSISLGKRRVQRGLFLAAILACLRRLPARWSAIAGNKSAAAGNEIMFAIDTSRSMLTPDVKPNRLTRAKLAIDDFAKQLDGDAVGIVAFAGSAFLACPITLDYGAFHESLGAIDTNTIPRGGTNISSAIRAAQTALRRRPGSDKILILVTDGEDLEGRRFGCGANGGTTGRAQDLYGGRGDRGRRSHSRPPDQGGGFVKDETGAFVKSRLDEPL